ncbi:MAG: hypothetical protein Q3965_01585 [Rothia sp. (in: high G+C Gram-positive bacteria)]|nr:hypothetical protein [Rothia sp. (in: high G+C Gram-positive bacteria)]
MKKQRRKDSRIPPIYAGREADAQGLTRNQWARNKRTHIQCGVYAKEGYKPPYGEYLWASAQSMPTAVLASVSAAYVHGMRLPFRCTDELCTFVITPKGTTQYRRAGVRRINTDLQAHEIVSRNGVQLTSLARTFFDLAQVLTFDELVAVADGLLARHEHRYQSALITREELTNYILSKAGRRGYRRCLEALDLAVEGSDSVKETELRLLLQRHGVTGLVCNEPVVNEVGWVLFQPDLSLPHLRLSIQYEGAHHNDGAQVRRDIRRSRAVEEAGWVEVRIYKDDLREFVNYQDALVPRAVALVKAAMAGRRAAAEG